MSFSIIGGADGPTSIFLAGKLGDLFMIPALLILAVFYAIYIGKMIIQKKKGIQTDQIGRKKEKSKRRTIEIILKLATYSIVVVEVISIFAVDSLLGMKMAEVGLILGIVGDVIFGIAVHTMKDSWRAGIAQQDKTEMVTGGIYKYSRNPAFLAFDLVYIGVLLMYFNWVLLIFTLWAIVMLHLQILQEEQYLPTVFGDKYLEYKKHTMRYLGRKR